MNAFDQVRDAVTEAKRLDTAVISNANAMADLLVGKLRRANIGCSTLRALKNELRGYNPHTRTWRDAK